MMTTTALAEQNKFADFASDAPLYAFIGSVAHVDMHREPGPQLAECIREAFGVDAVAVFDADVKRVYASGEWEFDPANFAQTTYIFESSKDDPSLRLSRRVLRVKNFPVGSLLICGELPAPTCDCIAALAAMTFDRYHSYANVGRTETARQAEQLRTTVLNSLAHAYKTPLTAIRVASTGLAEMDGLSTGHLDLIDLISEQANVLNELTTRLLKTAQLEAQDIALKPEEIAIKQMVKDALAACGERLESFSVQVSVVPEDLYLVCDRDLVTSMLAQYVDNAAKYGKEGSEIEVEVSQRSREVVFAVTNYGPQISAADQERIFDLYFRCPETASSTPGTGVGLSIARRAAQVHGGDVWLSSDANGRTTFFASLPIAGNGER